MVAALGAFGVGYVLGHAGPSAHAAALAVAEPLTRSATGTVGDAAGGSGPPRLLRSRLSAPMDTLALPRVKAYDLSAYVGKVVMAAPYGTKKVALTFDDGPSENTAAILDVLKQHRARATFFFVGGRMVGNEDIVLRCVQEGSEVGNHTWTHVSLVGLPAAQVEAQVRTTQEEILRTTGVENEFVRPRAGQFDATALAVVRKLGLVMVGWDAYGHDTFNDGKSVKQIERYAVKQTRGGSIILFHEVNPSTVKALPAILSRLEAEGYSCVTLGELLTSR